MKALKPEANTSVRRAALQAWLPRRNMTQAQLVNAVCPTPRALAAATGRVAIAATLLTALAAPTSAQLNEDLKLLASDGEADDSFGSSAASSGDTVIIGALGDDDMGLDAGAAYVFDVTTGQEVGRLIASDGEAGDFFGRSVAISGDMAVIGAPLDDGSGLDAGAAYVFDVTTGQEVAKLVASDGEASDYFGYSVAISGNTAVIGAWGEDDLGPDAGAAYVFDVTTGQEVGRFLASDGGPDDRFGGSVAISGGTVVIGAWGDEGNGPNTGAVYVFDVTTGQEVGKLLASDGEAGDYFGISTAISGDTAVIGAVGDGDNGSGAGAAYVFDVTTGQEVAKLLASDGEGGDEFGFPVAISGNTAAIGAGGDDDNGAGTGGTYLFDVTTGQEVAKLLASDGEPGDRFGGSVAITGAAVVVGAEGDGDNGAGAGAAYVFDLDDLVVEDSKLLALDGGAIDYFGFSMAIGGERAVIGSLRGGPLNSGAGYVFDLTTGLEVHSLYATDGVPDDFLGSSVAVSGDIAALGAPEKNVSTGAAYAFNLTTGQQLAKFVASDGQAFDRLGSSVALIDDPAVGEVLIVGSPYNSNQNGFSAGAAYVFDPYSGGTEIKKFVASDGEDGDRFCYSVAIQGQIAVIGAPGDEGWTGSAYVFNWWHGQEIGKLLALDGDPGDQFGAAVAIHGDIAVIGAVNDDDSGLDAGAAYLFDVTTGQQLAKLLARDGEADDRLGISVAIDGETVVLGASGDKDNGSYSGSAYVFDVNTGQEVAKLVASDGEADSYLGSSVAVGSGGDTILCGASWDDNEHGYNAGAAYVYDLGLGPDCSQTYCEGPANGNEGDLSIDTCVINGGPGNTLTLSNSPNALFGYPVIAATQGSVSNPPGATGELCVGPANVGRYFKDLQSTGGSGGYSVDIYNSVSGGGNGGIPLVAGGGVLMPGDTWHFQCWSRVPGSSTFSAALTVTFQ